MTNSWFISFLVGGLPFVALLASIQVCYWRRKTSVKTPFTGKLLRPPGESLREKLLELNEKMLETTLWFTVACVALGYMGYNWKFHDRTNLLLGWGTIIFGYGFCIFCAIRLFRTGRLVRDYNLGFLGERAVGEELNRMLAKGYEVFHDVQFEGRPGSKKFNIDHVAIGPGGVFCIETKTRRKQIKKGPDSSPNVVEFDGNRLNFPWGSDDFGIKQVRDNAAHLATWLQQAVGGAIPIIPVLALPGWSVDRKGKGDVRVVSGREICSAFPAPSASPVLTQEQIRRIAFQLEQRCRNIEVE